MVHSSFRLILAFLCIMASACGAPAEQVSRIEQTPENTDISTRTSSNRSSASATLSVGFSAVDLTWRAGAKPGQVGTEASIPQMALLWADIATLVARALPMQAQDDIKGLLQYATDWNIDYLEKRLDQIRYDKYTDVYQRGRGVHTRSWAKAMVLESNGNKVAVVKADLYLMQKHLWHRVTDLVAQETSLSPENILISATHNHSAADAAFTAAGVASLAENFDPRHFVFLSQAIAQAIIEADANRVPAKMGAIKTQLREVQRNVIGPATASVVPPGESETVEVQAGYPRDFFDDQVWVLHFEDASSNELLGAYVVFGMHPESLYEGHGLLSSDFPGLLEMGLEARWNAPVIWAPGALGDVEQDNGDVFGTDYWREDFLRLEQQADVLVEAIAPILETEPLSSDQVIPSSSDITIASRLSVLPGAANETFPGATPWKVPVTEYLSPELPLTCVRALTESANLMLQAIQLGDVVLLGSPSEVTTDMAMHIRSRIDDVEGNLYQGYIWPDSESWVEDEINQNFDPTELDASIGFAMPILLSQSNDYDGYMVTRWEFINRHHYRQEMTLFGQDTANYVATGFEGLVRELRGEILIEDEWDAPSELDISLEEEIYSVVSDLEPWVQEWARNIPPSNARGMGRIVQQPVYQDSDEMGAPSVSFRWKGGSSDLPIPTVLIQQLQPDGSWTKVTDENSPHVWLLYEPGGQWEVVWHLKDYPRTGSYRFRVHGLYRGEYDNTSDPDPIWDPDGRNASYSQVSSSFELM